MPSYNPDPMGVKATQLRQHRERLEHEAKAQTKALRDMQRSLQRQEREARQTEDRRQVDDILASVQANRASAQEWAELARERIAAGDADGAVSAAEQWVAATGGNATARNSLEMVRMWARTGDGPAAKRHFDALELRRRDAERAAERARSRGWYAFLFPFQLIATLLLTGPLGLNSTLFGAIFLGLVAVLIAFYVPATRKGAMLVMCAVWIGEAFWLSYRLLTLPETLGWPVLRLGIWALILSLGVAGLVLLLARLWYESYED